MKTYAVTGEHHGSIVEAYTRKKAIEAFQKIYKGEKIIYVKLIEPELVQYI